MVRKIRREDVKDIIEIMQSSKIDFPWGFYYNVKEFEEEEIWLRVRGSDEYPTMVAELEGKVIAYAKHHRHWDEKNNLYIELLITHPEFRGKGAGRKLIEKCFEIAVEKDFEVLSLHTWPNNRAVNLYGRTGFCWMPNSWVYMINFSPQLFKYKKVKKFVKEPVNLVRYLTKPPEKIELNGHVAWRYIWMHEDEVVEAIFDSDTKSLLFILVADDRIELNPPPNIYYIKDKEISFVVKTSQVMPIVLDKKPDLIEPGISKILKTKAKKQIKLRIGDYQFGFSMKIRKPVEVVPKIRQHIGNKTVLDIFVINNSEKNLEGSLLIETSGDVYVEPTKFDVKVEKNRYVRNRVMVEGFGKIDIRFLDSKTSLTIFNDEIVVADDDTIKSSYWEIKRDEITLKHPIKVNIYPEFYLNDHNIQFELKKGRLSYDTEDFNANIEPRIRGHKLKLDIDLKARKNISGYLHVYFWIEFKTEPPMFLLPIDKNTIIVERYTYPAFPKSFSIIRKKLSYPWFGFKVRNNALIIHYDKSGLYTMDYSPTSVRLDIPIDLKSGDSKQYTLSLELADFKTMLNNFKVERAIDLKTEDEYVIIKNNWLHPINLRFRWNMIEFSATLNSRERKKFLHSFEGFGVASLILEYEGLTETRKLFYMRPMWTEWTLNIAKSSNMALETCNIGGTLKKWIMGNKDILHWNEKPILTPFSIYKMHGGIPLNLMIDGEDSELHLTVWQKVDDGVYETESREIRVRRKWSFLDNDSILEEIIISNLSGRFRRIKLTEMVIFNDRFDEIGDDARTVKGDAIFSISNKDLIWISVQNEKIGMLSIFEQKEEDTYNQWATQLSNFYGAVSFQHNFTLEPLEIKVIRRIFTRSLNKLLEIKNLKNQLDY